MAKLSLRDALNTSLTRTKQYIDTELAKKADSSHGTHLTLGTGSGNAFRGDYGNTAYQHSQSAHAPSNAQKNSDITKAEIEAKLTGAITTHTHSYLPLSGGNITGDLKLYASGSNDSPSLIFYRGSDSDSYTDWRVQDRGGSLYFDIRTGSTTFTNKMTFNESGTISATSFTEGGTALADKYAAKSHGTHLTLGTGASNAAAGNHTHNYAGSSSAGGAATSANKVNTNLVVKLNSGTTEGTDLFTFNGSAAKTINITPSSIGAAKASHGTHVTYGGNGSATTVSRSDHTHSYLPLSGGTMTGKITTPNGAPGITIGDDVTLCDRNIADHLVLEGSTATNGGITFGSGKDTNIYRGGANLLKTDDTMNAVGGFQWNGQSLDSRYAAASHGTHLSLGTTSSTAYRGDYGNTAYNHSQSAHAPSNAQKNSDITKTEIENKLTGTISSHTHDYITSMDTRSANSAPNTYTTRGIYPEFKSTSTVGLPNSGKNFAGVITYQQWGDTTSWSGGKATQFATLDDGRMYFRKGEGTSWGAWNRFYTNLHKPDLDELGAAPASHGTHLTIGTGAGNAAAGNHTHKYAGSSSAGGAANNSEKFGGYSLWVGTQAQYDAISSKSSTTIYIIK